MTFSHRLVPAFALLLGLCGCTGDGGGDGGQARPQAPAAAPAVSPPRTPSLLPITLRAQAGKVVVDLHRGATTGRAGDAPASFIVADAAPRTVPGVDWPAYLVKVGLKPGDFAAMVQADAGVAARQSGIPAAPARGETMLLEPAWPFLEPAALAAQPWFVGGHSSEEKSASEDSYYGGAVRAVRGEIAAARAQGWDRIVLSWRRAPGAALTDGWAWERIAGPVVEEADAWRVELPTGRPAELAAELVRLQTRLADGRRRLRPVIALDGLAPEEARAAVVLAWFAGAEGVELRGGDATAEAAAHAGAAMARTAAAAIGQGLPATTATEAAAALATRRPLALRVAAGRRHAVLTWDPWWREAGAARSIAIALADLPGTTAQLPADRQPRIYLLEALSDTAAPAAATASAEDPRAVAALDRLARIVPRFRPLDLPASGTIEIPASAGLTIDDLRGVALDDDPPILGQAPGPGDGDAPTAYIAKGIAPFRFRHFTNEFNHAGKRVAGMQDYASAHGFDMLCFRPRTQNPHLPPGTTALKWLSRATPKDLVQHGRYDLLAERAEHEDLVALYASDPFSKASYEPAPGIDLLMIDIEHPVLKPEDLRKQEWYPRDAEQDARGAFETKYYRGHRLMYEAGIKAARQAGFPQVSIYGWYTVPRTWWGLEKLRPDRATDWAWQGFGKDLYPQVDVIHPSVYFFYCSSQNVAYSLANLDLTREFLAGLPAKPIRPYYMGSYHGGGASGLVWWYGLPVVDEEMRAAAALAFFTGIGGIDIWGVSLQPHDVDLPDPLKLKHLMVGQDFSCTADGAASVHQFRRYDVLHVLSCDKDSGETRFQLIRKDRFPDYGLGDGAPVFRMARDRLRPLLRPWQESYAALIEGLALAHPFEYLLKHGTIAIDVPAQEQYARSLPIIRRVRLGCHQVIATYDPNVLYAKMKMGSLSGFDPGTANTLTVNTASAGKGIELKDFDGTPGLTLRLPADDQVRFFVLRGK